MSARPATLIDEHVRELLQTLPSVRDGDVDGVHRARVATRRLREVFSVAGNGHAAGRETAKMLGRELGTVRELDVTEDVLKAAERHIPAAVATAAVARFHLRDQQHQARKRLIKALDRMEPERELRKMVAQPGLFSAMPRVASLGSWSRAARRHIRRRAERLNGALDRASGVYFPKRLHKVRVALKKLRYSVEVAAALGMRMPPRLLRDLKRAQAILGDIHDLQVTVDRIPHLAVSSDGPGAAQALVDGLKADIDRRFSDYLRQRDRLRDITGACRRFGTQRDWSNVSSAIAVTAGLVRLMMVVAERRPRGRESFVEDTPRRVSGARSVLQK